MTLTIDNDWAAIDNLESVTYQSKTGEGTYTSSTIQNVLERVALKTVNGKAMLNEQVHTFHVWANQTNITPKVNDKLISGGMTWVVKEVSEESLGTRFKLTCHITQ